MLLNVSGVGKEGQIQQRIDSEMVSKEYHGQEILQFQKQNVAQRIVSLTLKQLA